MCFLNFFWVSALVAQKGFKIRASMGNHLESKQDKYQIALCALQIIWFHMCNKKCTQIIFRMLNITHRRKNHAVLYMCDCLGRTAHRRSIPTGIFRLRAFRLLNREKVTMLLGVFRQSAERGEPGQGESAKDRLNALPPGLLHPTCLFLFQRFDSCLIIPDSWNLRPKHDGGEQGKQEALKQKKENKDHCGRGTVCRAVLPISVDASNEVMNAKKQTVIGDKANVEGEKNEKFLVLLPNTIVHPGTMVVHLFDAPLAYRAVMCSLWLDATALWAFEDNLSLLKPHSLNVLLCGISFRYSSGICEHCA